MGEGGGPGELQMRPGVGWMGILLSLCGSRYFKVLWRAGSGGEGKRGRESLCRYDFIFQVVPADKATSHSYYINVCRPLVPVPGINCPAGAFACHKTSKVTGKTSNVEVRGPVKVATVREKSVRNFFFSRSGKSQVILH